MKLGRVCLTLLCFALASCKEGSNEDIDPSDISFFKLSDAEASVDVDAPVAVVPHIATPKGATLVNCRIASGTTPLPAGLSVDPTTCMISGTSSVAMPATVFWLAATNSLGHVKKGRVKLRIRLKVPTLSYALSSGTTGSVAAAMSVTPSTLNSNGAAVSACGIKSGTTALPTTLSVDPLTCVISGTPTATLAATVFTIVATNSVGTSTDATVTLTIGKYLTLIDTAIPLSMNGTAYGEGHTCAVTKTKNVLCSGYNISGQLGVGDYVDSTTPHMVLGGEQGGTYLEDIVNVGTGRDNTCAVTSTGAVFCWGLGGTQLGNGFSSPNATTPVRVVTGDQGDASGFLARVTQLQIGYAATCARTSDGEAYCWGLGGNGRLGVNSTTSYSMPKKVFGGGQGGAYLTGVTSVSVGRATACAVTTANAIFCWGDGRGVGAGSTGNKLTPLQVLGGAQGGTYFTDAKSVDVGWNRTCALTNAGNVFCWGDGTVNALGHGIYEQVLIPVKVLGGTQGGTYLENVATISYGFAQACAITTTKDLYCWGNGFTATADKAAGGAQGSTYLSNIIGVHAGPTYTCATDDVDKSYCWGNNATGQFGVGSVNAAYDATPVFIGF